MHTTMKRLFLIFFLLVASLVGASAQDKLCCYVYAFSKHLDEVNSVIVNKHVCPQYEGDTRYFVYSKEHDRFARATSSGRVVAMYYIDYNSELGYYRIEDPYYAPIGEFISLRFDVLMVLRQDDAGQTLYDVYLLESIDDVE